MCFTSVNWAGGSRLAMRSTSLMGGSLVLGDDLALLRRQPPSALPHTVQSACLGRSGSRASGLIFQFEKVTIARRVNRPTSIGRALATWGGGTDAGLGLTAERPILGPRQHRPRTWSWGNDPPEDGQNGRYEILVSAQKQHERHRPSRPPFQPEREHIPGHGCTRAARGELAHAVRRRGRRRPGHRAVGNRGHSGGGRCLY